MRGKEFIGEVLAASSTASLLPKDWVKTADSVLRCDRATIDELSVGSIKTLEGEDVTVVPTGLMLRLIDHVKELERKIDETHDSARHADKVWAGFHPSEMGGGIRSGETT